MNELSDSDSNEKDSWVPCLHFQDIFHQVILYLDVYGITDSYSS